MLDFHSLFLYALSAFLLRGEIHMDDETIPFERKRLEQSISKIGAKVADAVELSTQAKELTTGAESILISVQQELEELYLSLDHGNK